MLRAILVASWSHVQLENITWLTSSNFLEEQAKRCTRSYDPTYRLFYCYAVSSYTDLKILSQWILLIYVVIGSMSDHRQCCREH